jgi:hypothetical protein
LVQIHPRNQQNQGFGEIRRSPWCFYPAPIAPALGRGVSMVTPYTEILLIANDLEQVLGRIFKTAVALLRQSPRLGASATILADEIRLSNGTVILPRSSDYKGIAGARHSLYVVDEPCGVMEERAVRLIDEVTPPLTEPNAWGLMTTTAGFSGESKFLEEIYQRGLTGERLDPDLEVYQADELVMFWSHTPRQPWQSERYCAEQRRSLRPGTFARLHRNEWVAAESTFLPAHLWDAATDPEHRPMLPNKTAALYLGVDAGIKDDLAAVVGICRAPDGENWLELAFHRIWRPSKEAPLDLEDTIESFLLECAYRYHVARILCDPYQLHRSMTTLKRRGLRIENSRRRARTSRGWPRASSN